MKQFLIKFFAPKRCKIHNTFLIAQRGWDMKRSMYCPTCLKELADTVIKMEQQREEERWRRQARIFREELSKGPEYFKSESLH